MLLKTEAASTFAVMTPHRRLCVPVLLAINFMKMESPANLQVNFQTFFKTFGLKFLRPCAGFRDMNFIDMQYPVGNLVACFPA